jgi:hypothetical protein
VLNLLPPGGDLSQLVCASGGDVLCWLLPAVMLSAGMQMELLQDQPVTCSISIQANVIHFVAVKQSVASTQSTLGDAT